MGIRIQGGGLSPAVPYLGRSLAGIRLGAGTATRSGGGVVVAPSIAPPTRASGGTYTPVKGSAGSLVPYTGPRPVVVTLPGVRISTGNGIFDWGRSLGGYRYGGGCSSDDMPCATCRTVAGSSNMQVDGSPSTAPKGGADVVVGLSSDGTTPEALVCYINPFGGPGNNPWIYTPEVQTTSAGSMPTIFGTPGWEMKRALWLLPNQIDAVITATGGTPAASESELDVSHNHLTLDLVSDAVSALGIIQSGGQLGRALSLDSSAFLSSPSIGGLALAAPAIVWDCAAWLAASGADQGQLQTGNSAPAPSAAPASGGLGKTLAIGAGLGVAALLLRALL